MYSRRLYVGVKAAFAAAIFITYALQVSFITSHSCINYIISYIPT